MRVTLIAFFCLVGLISPCCGFNEEEAAEKWGHAYVWLQTGRNLANSGQKPLAVGSYIEAAKLFKELAENFPGYETKMVTYRIEALDSDIVKMKAELSPEDLIVADEYAAFIKLIEKADDQRYSAQRKQALNTLRQAKAGLDAIVARRPDDFGPAVKDQSARLQTNISWLEKLTKSRPVPPMAYVPPEPTGFLIKGTTEFITGSDLPAPPGDVGIKSLFPNQ